jgi:hypothetical protein
MCFASSGIALGSLPFFVEPFIIDEGFFFLWEQRVRAKALGSLPCLPVYLT